ncbi:hypothetical protein LTR62_007155 [Meristemomyces frigidus]|uniref:Uncharacterized protein n=1 Tax=Meristemomyces frigidus TaxID=1508187 RepID=A0AAN7TER3_9PEZI|nr:hypothetical protein LTR62_007155 [Meristemomyces frigidus]
MSSLDYFTYAGDVGKYGLETLGYSQAVRVPPGSRVEVSGQAGGWDPETHEVSSDVSAQIDQAFSNIQLALTTAGVKDGLSSVFSIKSYHVGFAEDHEEIFKAMKKNFEKWMPGHKPIWTLLGVARLGMADMKVEIDVVAWEK